ncbi:MAG: anhydro-N-acetylmuramic acid kinase [Ignavibacteria bacterium]|nr:anhydro-N-acetylmuramic acid kinase [Ignavibacteria bacterium]
MRIAGVMTGTSFDAIDVAICDIQPEGDRDAVSLFAFKSFPFQERTQELLRHVVHADMSLEQLSDLAFVLAREYAEAIRDIEREHSTSVEAVAIHGQTIWHHPPYSTWQIGSGPALSALLARTVVSDFRSADVALGGQGAPLVPIFDHATLCKPSTCRVALNIGGMANLTLLPPACSIETLQAFDTGPGNVWIDAGTRLTFGKHYDKDGAIARAGRIIAPMLAEMQSMPYFSVQPPKSTGRELFTLQEAQRLITKYSQPSSPLEDVVSTMTELTAWSIADHIHRYAPVTKEIIISGGGSQNSFLLERLEAQLIENQMPTKLVVHEHWQEKEAMAFAYLGFLTLSGRPGNVPSVTGATKMAVLGSVSSQHVL